MNNKTEVTNRSRGGVTVTVNGLYIFDCILVNGHSKIIARRYTSRCSKDQKGQGSYCERVAREAANRVLLPQNPNPAFDGSIPIENESKQPLLI